MGAHVGFDEGGATFTDHVADGGFQLVTIGYLLY